MWKDLQKVIIKRLAYYDSRPREHAVDCVDGARRAVRGDAVRPEAVRPIVRAVVAALGHGEVQLQGEVVVTRARLVHLARTCTWVVLVRL